MSPVGITGPAANGPATIGTNTTTAAGGLWFGTDTNLYRSAADTLKTDDALQSAGLASTALVDVNAATALRVRNGATDGFTLQQQGADSWHFVPITAVAGSRIGVASAEFTLNSTTGMMTFGTARDTNLYRSAADTLKTDDSFIVGGSATMLGALTLSGAAPQISLSNGTSNWINWSGVGAAPPAFTTRSTGTKLVLFPSISGSATDYAIGIDSGTIWNSVPSTSGLFKWFGGVTLAATLSGAGNLSLAGNVTIPVASGATSGNLFFIGDTSAGTKGMRMFSAGTSSYIDVNASAAGEGLIFRADLTTGGAERMRIRADGDIWIGYGVIGSSGTYLSLGAAPALSGAVRLPALGAVTWRNFANSADFIGIRGADTSQDNISYTAGVGVSSAHNFYTGPGSTLKMQITQYGYALYGDADISGLARVVGSVAIGTNPATTGALRLAYQGKIVSRNSANSTDVNMLWHDNTNTYLDTDQYINFQIAGSTLVWLQGTGLTFQPGINVVLDTTTGTKIGTATTQKLAFWNATPVVQPANTVAIDTLLTTLGLRASGGTANFASSLTLSSAAPQISLTNATSNWITMGANGIGAPTFTTRSAGTKLVLSDSLSGSQADFAMGIESLALWSSVHTTAGSFKWYGGTTLAATLTGTGNFLPVGALTLSGAAPQMSLTNGTSNMILMGAAGGGVPTFTTRSDGTKIVLWSAVDASHVDYAIGLNSSDGTVWNSVATTAQQFRWYGGTSLAATLTGAGVLTLVSSAVLGGSLTLPNGTYLYGRNLANTGSLGLIVAGSDDNTYVTGRSGGFISLAQQAGAEWFRASAASNNSYSPLVVFGGLTVTGTTVGGPGQFTYAASTNLTTYAGNFFSSPKNTVTLFLGDQLTTAAYGINEFSADVRWNGGGVAWGDLGYYPTGGDAGEYGHFRFSIAGAGVVTTPNAKVGVGDLFVASQIGVNTMSPTANSRLHLVGSNDPASEVGAIVVSSATTFAKKINVGFSDTYNAGYVQGIHSGVAWLNTMINPVAGNVLVGTTVSSGLLSLGTNTTTPTSGIYFGTDTYLYRSATTMLGTSGGITVNAPYNATTGLDGVWGTSPQPGLTMTTSGTGRLRIGYVTAGSGDYFPKIGFLLNATGAANVSLVDFRQSGDTTNLFQIYGNGLLAWGPGGSTAQDTNLYRSAADTLRTDDSFIVGGSLTVTGAFIPSTMTLAGAAPQLSLTNATSNWIAWPVPGVGPPTFTTTSVGTRLLIYPDLGAARANFAIGIEGGAMWQSVSDTAQTFKWYGGTTLAATLSGLGDLTLVRDLQLATGNRALYTTAGNIRYVVPAGSSHDMQVNNLTKLLVGGSVVAVVDALSIGTTPATTGTLRMPNAFQVSARNGANSLDKTIFWSDGNNTFVDCQSGSATVLSNNGTTKLNVLSTAVTSADPIAIGTNPATTGALRLANNSGVYARNAANSVNAALLKLNTSDVVQIAGDGNYIALSGRVCPDEAIDFQFGLTTGTKLGVSAANKLAFWGATPVVQPAGWGTPSGTVARTTYATSTATLTQVAERLAALITDLKTIGVLGA